MAPWFQTLTHFTGQISGYIWGIPSIVFLVGTGVYLTIRLGFIQLRGFKKAIHILRGKDPEPDAKGDTTPFQALCTSLSATVGTGNIAGVATAVFLGGPGALFWMWLTAVVGMATRFASSTLAVRFRQINPQGDVSGGPMYTLKYGLKMPRLGAAYALFTLIASFGIGNTVQVNSIVGGLGYIIPQVKDHHLLIGIVLAVLIGCVILGGIKRIAHVATVLVPFMAIIYFLAAIIVIISRIDAVPESLATIFNLALNPHAAGAAAIGIAIHYGVARGVFSNEAGLGSATIVHATAKTKEPARQGLVAMLGPFVDTIIICTLTGLVLVVTGAWGNNIPAGLNGAALSAYAFSLGSHALHMGDLGGWIVGISLTLFAFSTIISWSYYGDRCAQFLWGDGAIFKYRLVFTCAVVLGAIIPLQLVWNLADIANMLMAIPNLISIILLAKVVHQLQKNYFQRKATEVISS